MDTDIPTTAEQLDAWAAHSLRQRLGIDDETCAAYLLQICAEPSIPADEKRSALAEFLADVTEAPVEDWLDELLAHAARVADAQSAEEMDRRKRTLDAQREREQAAIKTVLAVDTANGSSLRSNTSDRQLSKEEKRARDRIIARYEYDNGDIVETSDGEMEIVYADHNISNTVSTEGLQKNRNVDVVKEEERARRLKAQAEHAKTVQRNKEALEKQKLDKEKEKRRTQKKEKRRL